LDASEETFGGILLIEAAGRGRFDPASQQSPEGNMRFAAVATIGAALAAGAFLGAALTPGMSEPDFLRAARCVAYDAFHQDGPAASAELRARLAFEQHAQPAQAVARARREIRAIGDRAAESGAENFRNERDAACGDPA
jgi:hypothetical protein